MFPSSLPTVFDTSPPRRMDSYLELSGALGSAAVGRNGGAGAETGGGAGKMVVARAPLRQSEPPRAVGACKMNLTDGGLGKQKITLGICCMAKKIKTSTMQALMKRFDEFGEFTIVQFSENLILNEPICNWPVVDCMISFFSAGFPLEKAVQYSQRNPQTYYLIDPATQRVLLDRRSFYSALKRNNVPVVEHHYCSRDGYEGAPMPTLEEYDDYIVINGARLDKPFVEKPTDSEDHSVRIYYSKAQGSGCTEMMRKVGNKSSEFLPDVTKVRREGSFIYERYVDTADLQDVKCYTVGPNYVHAESRKAPVVDGVVTRDQLGKEIRRDEQLTPDELMVARKIIKIFRQMVCGFDILRSRDHRFFVCDVNGWSFVKNNDRYVQCASQIMRDIFVEEVRKRGLHRAIIKRSVARELCGIVGVFRHADRTPKQKCKIEMTHPRLLGIAFSGDLVGAMKESGEVVFKSGHAKLVELESALAELLANVSVLSSPLQTPAHVGNPPPSFDHNFDSEFRSLGPSLMNESFPAAPAATTASAPPQQLEVRDRDCKRLRLMLDVLRRRNEGLKVQFKPQNVDDTGRVTSALMVCKWGGWLTEAGHKQASELGRHFINRVFGADASAAYTNPHAVSCSVNNERRVQHTAHALLEEFFGGSGEMCPIVVEENLLGETADVKAATHRAAEECSRILHMEKPEDIATVEHLPGVQFILHCIVLDQHERTPLGALRKLHTLLQQVLDFIPREAVLYRGESVALMRQRWELIAESFFTPKKNRYDATKIPEIFDYVSYDVCYNQEALAPLDLYPLFTLAEALNAFASDAEYGITRAEKKEIGCLTVAPLLRRVLNDLNGIKAGVGARTRLYFTSESHVVALYNALYNSEATSFHELGEPQVMHFLSHFVFKLYRYPASASGERSGTEGFPPQKGWDTSSAGDERAAACASPGFTVSGPVQPSAPPLRSNSSLTQSSAPQALGPPPEAHSTSMGSSLEPAFVVHTPVSIRDEQYQLEVHFSNGVDKNMFGIVENHHASYAAVTPMIRIHNNLDLDTFATLVAECGSEYDRKVQRRTPNLPSPKPHAAPSGTEEVVTTFPEPKGSPPMAPLPQRQFAISSPSESPAWSPSTQQLEQLDGSLSPLK